MSDNMKKYRLKTVMPAAMLMLFLAAAGAWFFLRHGTQARTYAVRITVVPPAYTGLSDTIMTSIPDSVSAPAGSDIHIILLADGRAGGAACRLESEEHSRTVQAEKVSSDKLFLAFRAQETSEVEIEVGDLFHRPLADKTRFSLRVLEDAPPAVRLEPVSESAVNGDETRHGLRISATDDFGLQTLALVLRIPGRPDCLLPVQPGPEKHRVITDLTITPVQFRSLAQKNGVVFAEASDNCPSRLNVVRSNVLAAAGGRLAAQGHGDTASPSVSTRMSKPVKCGRLVYGPGMTVECFSREFLRETVLRTGRRIFPCLEPCDASDGALQHYPMIIMGGKGCFALSPAEQHNISGYLKQGGMLLAAPSCGDGAWMECFLKEISAILPGYASVRLSEHAGFRRIMETFEGISETADTSAGHLVVLMQGNDPKVIYCDVGLNDSSKVPGCCCCGGTELADSQQLMAVAFLLSLGVDDSIASAHNTDAGGVEDAGKTMEPLALAAHTVLCLREDRAPGMPPSCNLMKMTGYPDAAAVCARGLTESVSPRAREAGYRLAGELNDIDSSRLLLNSLNVESDPDARLVILDELARQGKTGITSSTISLLHDQGESGYCAVSCLDTLWPTLKHSERDNVVNTLSGLLSSSDRRLRPTVLAMGAKYRIGALLPHIETLCSPARFEKRTLLEAGLVGKDVHALPVLGQMISAGGMERTMAFNVLAATTYPLSREFISRVVSACDDPIELKMLASREAVALYLVNDGDEGAGLIGLQTLPLRRLAMLIPESRLQDFAGRPGPDALKMKITAALILKQSVSRRSASIYQTARDSADPQFRVVGLAGLAVCAGDTDAGDAYLKDILHELQNIRAVHGTVQSEHAEAGMIRTVIADTLAGTFQNRIREPGRPANTISALLWGSNASTELAVASWYRALLTSTISGDTGVSDSTYDCHVAFFTSAGCPNCQRARALLGIVENELGRVETREYDLSDPDAVLFNESLSEALGVDAGKRLSAPAIFTSNGAVAGDFDLDSIMRLVSASKGLQAPWDIESLPSDAAAAESILKRFKSLTFVTVVVAGLVDGVNPCAFTTMLFLLSYLALRKRTRSELALTGMAFTAAVFATYFVIGLGFLEIVRRLTVFALLSTVIRWIAGGMAALAGVLSFMDGVNAARGNNSRIFLKLPPLFREHVQTAVRESTRSAKIFLAAAVAGATVSLLELVCTGQVYAPTIVYVVRSGTHTGRSVAYLFLYNTAFIIPLLGVFVVTYAGASSSRIAGLFKRRLALVRFLLAVVFILLAVLILVG
ncbi:MAG: DUF4175 family protein [Planctomycetes bacterium]|nr:DUF4175 family protein [Planctomycetota bacterium]